METLWLIVDHSFIVDFRVFKSEVQSVLAHDIEREGFLNF